MPKSNICSQNPLEKSHQFTCRMYVLCVPRWCHCDNSYNNGLQSVTCSGSREERRSTNKHFRVAIIGEKHYACPAGRGAVESNHIFQAHLRHGVSAAFLPPQVNRIIAPSSSVYLWYQKVMSVREAKAAQRGFPVEPRYVTSNKRWHTHI